ncbi:MAG TPA: hypothetical protein VN541_10895 [Tepidisphaeraceae bacterium]|nr:hypothetical protein [Tepidisphaeraceae bacterium]
MLPVESAIYRVRRDLILTMLLKAALAVAIAGCFLVGPENARLFGLLGIGAFWMWLSISSARSSRTAAESPSLIAAGQFDEAERNIEQTVRTFSIFRAVKLQSLHHLALLRHAQRRWRESAVLSRELLDQRLGALQPISRPTRLLLADSLLEMGDLHGAHEAMAALSYERLSLPETLNLLAVQLDYSSRVGAWGFMMHDVMNKVQKTELMPPPISARSQAFLALAARRKGRQDFAAWLMARAELLADVQRLITERPILRELWT